MEYDHEVMMYYQRRYMQATSMLVVMLLLTLSFFSTVLGHVDPAVVFFFTAMLLITQNVAESRDGFCRSFWSKFVEPRHRPMDEWEEDLVDRGKIPE